MSSEDTTKDMNELRSFEERVLKMLEDISARLESVESKVEQRMFDTKPIWERALKEIMEVNQLLASLNRKIDVLGKDMLTLRADQLGIETRLKNLEAQDKDNLITIG
ncbi:MAG TPA: hypothetical protein VER76_21970 [Pyrinomonadaceae bacterium]|nr:hypothetical protein [Pyrinomonadaceae bacterium]